MSGYIGSSQPVAISSGSVETADILDDAVTSAKIAEDAITDIELNSSKLNAIEASATADQTNAEIKTAYEANSDTNEFSDAEQTKLSAIEASATADQTNAEIKAAVEAATDSNTFTDADHSKLNAIEASATADQTGAEIKTAYAAEANAYTDTKDTKLSGIETSATADQTKADIEGLGIAASSITGALPAISGANLTGLAIPTLDSPSITGVLFVDSSSNVSHTISNWSDDVTYVITGTNCTLGSVNSSGVFVVTHTSGTPSYTIKATTDSLGLSDSALVTKNIVINLSAPTLSSPADTTANTNLSYTITSTDVNDDKLILDLGTTSFGTVSVSVGSVTTDGNTIICTGFTTNNPVVTFQFTALGTYAAVKAKSVKIDGTYGDSAYSASDSILIYEQLSAPSLNSPADTNDSTAVTYTISSINSNATKVIFDAQSSNFTYGSVGSGSGSKVGNTVEITGWSGTSVTVTLTYTTAATYNNRVKVTATSANYTDSNYSSTDTIVISVTGMPELTSSNYTTYFPNATGLESGENGVRYETPGTYSWTVPVGFSSDQFRIWIVGGGGGTGNCSGHNYGGGGSGGVVLDLYLTAGNTYSIVVGDKGSDNSGGNAPTSSFGSFGSATGGGNATCGSAGGGGGYSCNVSSPNTCSGGNGGGGAHQSTAGSGNWPTAAGGGADHCGRGGGGGGGKGYGGGGGAECSSGTSGTYAQYNEGLYGGTSVSSAYYYGAAGGGGEVSGVVVIQWSDSYGNGIRATNV